MAVNIGLEIIPKCNLIPSEAYCFLLLFLKYTWTTFEKESRDQNWKKIHQMAEEENFSGEEPYIFTLLSTYWMKN